MLAPWIGGASSPSPVPKGYRSMLAFWVGGACSLTVSPRPSSGDGEDGPGRKARKQPIFEPYLGNCDEKDLREILTVLMLIWPDSD